MHFQCACVHKRTHIPVKQINKAYIYDGAHVMLVHSGIKGTKWFISMDMRGRRYIIVFVLHSGCAHKYSFVHHQSTFCTSLME